MLFLCRESNLASDLGVLILSKGLDPVFLLDWVARAGDGLRILDEQQKRLCDLFFYPRSAPSFC